MLVPAHGCFPVPDALSDADAALLEPLGVALHAVDLGRLRLARSVVVLGCGPIGLLIIRLAQLAGADPIYACDRFPWRVHAALAWGASDAWCCATKDSVARVQQLTGSRGADVVFEAAWAQESVAEAAEMARPGGRVVLVGIPSVDILTMKHSTARRKGLTILMSRRMKHTYPRAIRLALGRRVRAGGADLAALFPGRNGGGLRQLCGLGAGRAKAARRALRSLSPDRSDRRGRRGRRPSPAPCPPHPACR